MATEAQDVVRYQQPDTGLIHREPLELSVDDIIAKVAKVRQVAENVMKEDVHFGTIPGTPKPTLYKPGGEILCLTFRLSPKYDGERSPIDLGNGHREYIIRCDLYHIHTGAFFGSGIGSCSTLESKYRYRPGPKESTGQPVPHDYWDRRKTDPQGALQSIGGKGHTVGKDEDGKWVIMRQGEAIENPNIADCYNTVLKIAGKRAFLDAVLKATAASEVYTQDLEDQLENEQVHNGGQAATQPRQATPIQQPQRKSETAPGNGGGDVISAPQVKRLWAVGFGKKLTKDQIISIIKAYGYDHADKIAKSDYERICSTIEKGQVPVGDDEPPSPADQPELYQ